MSDDEVDALLSGIEDSQGQVNYEGIHKLLFCINFLLLMPTSSN